MVYNVNQKIAAVNNAGKHSQNVWVAQQETEGQGEGVAA